MKNHFNHIINFIRDLYPGKEIIPLHEPIFSGNELKYLKECIETTFVSSVGPFVDRFEKMIEEYTGAKKAIVCVSGTNALHIALLLSGVESDDEVITQSLTFIATANAIRYCGANPVFLDVNKKTLGLDPNKLEDFLSKNTNISKGNRINKISGKRIKACIPMHTFGHPSEIESIKEICDRYQIVLIEDAAESLGSKYKNKHTGTFGQFGILSFNGNKTITTGGGGMILTNDLKLGERAKHLTTQAKSPHPWEYIHDEIGYNYRMPNLNAALGCAQLENLDVYISKKREIANGYKKFFESINISFFSEPENSFSNYWLNAIFLKDRAERDAFLEYTNSHGIRTRPAWRLMNKLIMFQNCVTGDLSNANEIEDTLVNLPSSVPNEK
jgi:aminotransferase in exopolysaccharide biosynthesis